MTTTVSALLEDELMAGYTAIKERYESELLEEYIAEFFNREEMF